MKKKSVIITAVIFTAVMAALMGAFFGMRSRIGGRHIPTGDVISLYGVTNMTAGNAGETMEGLLITLPSEVSIENIVSVSSNPEVAYIEISRDSEDNRTYGAKIVMKSPGIVRLKVSSTDGKYVSKELTINVVGETTEITTVITEQPEGYVYVTPTGKKYHLRSSCAGKTSFPIEFEVAVEEGYTPCKSCAVHKNKGLHQ